MQRRFRVRSLFSLLLVASLPLLAVRAQGSAEWQQRVEYNMDVSLLADRHQMEGRQTARYYNNSPDTLHRVFYHLYFNAFQPHSMMAERNRHLPDPDPRIVPRIFNLGPDEIGYHHIRLLTQNGRSVPFDVVDTVMEVHLAEPIPPGGSAVFEMNFHSQVPLQTRRSGRDSDEGIDYSMTQWYPKLANYDERGWHADPYVGREFYAPFGTFDVRITLPSEYIIGSTGELQNAHQIGHGYDTTATVPDSDSLTWHFHAENVHDFAWAADPDYIHEIVTQDGIDHHLLYQPDVAEAWQGLRDDLPAMIAFFSENYGPYPYPQVTVVQGGDGGMEYPMITLITGRRTPRSVLGVTAHEIAHMWYYSILASNEADYAWMDEGFTTYTSTEVMAHLEGRPRASHLGAYYSILSAHEYGYFERLNTPSDWFRTNTGYSAAAYTGGQMIVDMLGYVISDSLRDRFLLEYFDRFKFRHPNPYDVEKVAEDVSGLHLDWFFEQFANSDRTVDYAVDNVRSRRSEGVWHSEIVIERRGDAALPIDLRLTFDDGTQQWVNIPLGIMRGHKPVSGDWIVADPWHWTFPEYVFDLTHQKRLARAEIDPTLHTPDVNRLNNTSTFPTDFAFLNAPVRSLTKYSIGWRPLLQYANNFGIGGGLQFRGTYLFDQFRTRAMLKLWPQLLFSDGEEPELARPNADVSVFDGIDYELSISDHIEGFGPYGVASLRSQKHLGVQENEVSFSTPLHLFDILRASEHRITFGLLHQLRTTDRAQATDAAFGFLPKDMLSSYLAYTFTDDRSRVDIRADLGGMIDDHTYWSTSASRVYVDAARSTGIGPFTAGARIRIGWGAPNLALQKQFRLGAASFEDRWGDDAYRTVAAFFDEPVEDAHWIGFAGPGPVAYTLSDDTGLACRRVGGDFIDHNLRAPIGNHIVAASAVLVAEPFSHSPWLRPLQAELFFGGGDAWEDGSSPDRLLYDAGIGLRYDVSDLPVLRRWTAQSDVLSNMNLTAKFPLWASDEDLRGSSDAFDFRWLIGVTIDDAPWY